MGDHAVWGNMMSQTTSDAVETIAHATAWPASRSRQGIDREARPRGSTIAAAANPGKASSVAAAHGAPASVEATRGAHPGASTSPAAIVWWWRKAADEYHQTLSSHHTGRALLLSLMLATLPAAHSLTNATVDGSCGPGGWSVSPSGKCYRLAPAPETVEVRRLSTYFECSETCGLGASLACLDSEMDVEFLSAALLGAWKERLPSTWQGIPLSAYVFMHGVNDTAQCSSRRASSSPLHITNDNDADSGTQYIHMLVESIRGTWRGQIAGPWRSADGRVDMIRESARRSHKLFRRSFCICEQGIIEEPKFLVISDHHHWSRLRYATAMFFLPAIFASLAPFLVAGVCCVCIPRMTRSRCATNVPHFDAHQAYVVQMHSWRRSAGVYRTRFLAVLFGIGWPMVVFAVNPCRALEAGGVTTSPAFWERFGYCEYYWALFPGESCC